MSSTHILMCPANFFGIEYEINAWMNTGNQVNHDLALRQWQQIFQIYSNELGWQVDLATPVEHLPDMVFATDCCLMIDGKILLSNFRHPERQPETMQFETWLRAHGFEQMRKAHHHFEGGGDNLVCGSKILAGHGFRSEEQAAQELEAYFGREVIPLKLIDPYFYHLDTAVAVLSNDTVAFYPNALDKPSQQRLYAAIPNVIEATLSEARGFGLNAVSDGQTVITSNESASLLQKYEAAGFKVIGTNIGEFKKSGGGVKCMTLELRA